MKGIKKFYVAKFNGRIKKYLRVGSFSKEEAITEILKKIPQIDNGVLKIYMVNIFNGKEKLIKKILILSELFLTKAESKALVLPFIHR